MNARLVPQIITPMPFERRMHDGSEVVFIDVGRIKPSPYQPRTIFDADSIRELADSIVEFGVMQPITVRAIGQSAYELVAGERRLRASKMAGLPSIPAVVVSISDKESALLALIENIQRENLNFFDEAESLRNLMDDYGLTQEEVAKKIGKNQSTVANKLRTLRIPLEIRRVILENDLTERHARALLKIPGGSRELISRVVNRVIEGGLNVKQTEELIDSLLAKPAKTDAAHQDQGQEDSSKKKSKVKAYFKDLRMFKNTIEQALELMSSAGLATDLDIEEREDGCFVSILISYT